MATSAKRPARGRWRPLRARAEAALRSGASIEAPELIQLIHEVNPSGHELEAEAEHWRYQLKSRLQSLLITNFKEQLEVAPLPASPDVVSLLYRPQNRDACHAVVADLEEGARSWVRLTLDLQVNASPPAIASCRSRRKTSPAPNADHPSTPEAYLRAGREAIALYDLESARENFARALELSDGATQPAHALLGLLVDQLAMYAEAVELEAQLSSGAVADSEIRSLLGLAFAHLGEAAETTRMLKDMATDRAAEALVILARRALREGATSEAEQWASRAQQAAPTHQEVVTVREELKAAKASACRPFEEELERLIAAGNEAAIEQCARGLLRTFPESAVARKVVRGIEDRRRAEAAQLHRARGEEAFGRGDYEEASTLLRQAQQLGMTGLEGQIACADRLGAERSEQARIEQTIRAFVQPPGQSFLLLYLAQDPRVREAVRARLRLDELVWLEELRPRDEKQARAAAAAALAFRFARSLPVEKESEGLQQLIEHEALLQHLQPARQWIAQARRRWLERKSAEAYALLARATEALGRHKAGEVLRLLSPATLRELPERYRGQANHLLEQATRAEQQHQQREHLEQLVRSNQMIEALTFCRTLVRDEPEERHWRDRMRQIQAALREHFCVRVASGSFRLGSEFLSEWRSFDRLAHWLEPSREKLYLLSAHGAQLFIRVVQIPAFTVDQLISLRTPEPMDFFDAHVEPQLLRICGGGGAVLELALDTWDIERWIPAVGRVSAEEIFESALAVPQTDLLWMVTSSRASRRPCVRVLDLSRDRPPREVTDALSAQLLPGPAGARVFVTNTRQCSVHEPNGSQVVRFPTGSGAAAPAPHGPGWVATLVGDDELRDEIGLALVGADGSCRSKIVISDSSNELKHILATSLSAQRTFLVFLDNDLREWLLAIVRKDEALAIDYRARLPRDSLLFGDLSSERTILVSDGRSAPHLQFLGSARPAIEVTEEVASVRIPDDRIFSHCGETAHKAEAQLEDLASDFSTASDATRSSMLEMYTKNHADDESLLIHFVEKLQRLGLTSWAENLASFVWSRHRGKPLTSLHRASTHARRGEWTKVINILSTLDAASLPSARRQHLHHLEGMLRMIMSSPAEALVEFSAGEVLEGDCELTDWRELAAALSDPMPPTLQPQSHGIRELVERLRIADRHLAREEGAAAWAVLDAGVVWAADDLQLLARLASAALLVKPTEGEALFRMRLAAAWYVERFRNQMDRVACLAQLRWTKERLEDISSKAENWLHGSLD